MAKKSVRKNGNQPDLDKLQGKVLAKDKHEKAVKSLEGAKFQWIEWIPYAPE